MEPKAEEGAEDCGADQPTRSSSFDRPYPTTEPQAEEQPEDCDADQLSWESKTAEQIVALLQNENSIAALTESGTTQPTSNQCKLLTQALQGVSTIAEGAYGRSEHLAVQVAALEVAYRAKSEERTPKSRGFISPSVIYLTRHEEVRQAFEEDLYSISNNSVRIGSFGRRTSRSVLSIDVPRNQWDVVCATPALLNDALTHELIHLGRLRLLIVDEANDIRARWYFISLGRIGDFLSQHQVEVEAALMHVDSTFTDRQKQLLFEQFPVPSPCPITFSSDSDARMSLELTFQTLPNKCQFLRPHRTREFIQSSRMQDRAVIVITSDEDGEQLEAPELEVFLGEKVFEERMGRYHSMLDGRDLALFEMRNGKLALVITLADTTSLVAPTLRGFKRDISVCISRLPSADGKRDGFAKWLDLVARLTRIEQVKHCHTLIETGRVEEIDAMSRWMKEMRGEVPDSLLYPVARRTPPAAGNN